MSFYAGRAASVTISASARPFDEWQFEWTCEAVSTFNFTSSNYEESVAGANAISISYSGPYDGSETVIPGDSTAVTVAAGGGGPSFVITNRCTSASVATSAKGKLTIAYKGIGNGSHSLTL